MILMRETTPATIRLGTVVAVVEHAVDAHPHAQLAAGAALLVGLGLEVDVGGAALGGLGDDRVDELDDRRVLGGLAQVDDLHRRGAVLVLVDRLLRPRPRSGSCARSAPAMSSAEATAGLDVEARQQRDVVDREDVGRVGHRQQQRVLVDVGDGHRAVALGRRRR